MQRVYLNVNMRFPHSRIIDKSMYRQDRNKHTLVKWSKNEMISFDHRVLSEYRIKIAKIETLAKSIISHKDSKSEQAKGASEFLDVLIDETDRFYEDNSAILSKNGKRPHNRSKLVETKEWSENLEKYYEENPRRRPRK